MIARPLIALTAAALLACSSSPGPGPNVSGETPPEDTMNTAAPLEVGDHFDGRIQLMNAMPGGPVPRFEGLVIQTPEAYKAFVDRLPERQIRKKQPAPPSEDPLLARPDIDFSRHALIVAIRGDSMYVGPEIGAPRDTADGGVAFDVTFPDVGESGMYAAMGGIGTYQARVIESPEGSSVILVGPPPETGAVPPPTTGPAPARE